MKRVFSILFASLILVSGLHLTVASHICCGELAAVKYSFTGEKATCGMEDNQSNIPTNGLISNRCCENRVSTCISDTNYFPSSREVKELPSITAPLFSSLPTSYLPSAVVTRIQQSMVGPPVPYSYTSVEQSFICVFII